MPNKIINYISAGISEALQKAPNNPFALSYVRQRFNTVIPDKVLETGWAAIKKYFEETDLPKNVRAEPVINELSTTAHVAEERHVMLPMRFDERIKLKLYGYNNITVDGVMRVPVSIFAQQHINDLRVWLLAHRNSAYFEPETFNSDPSSINWDYDHTVEIDTIASNIHDDMAIIMTTLIARGAEERTT